MKVIEAERMCCPYCASTRFRDDHAEDDESEIISYRCLACGHRWTYDIESEIQTYDNGNGGTTRRKLVFG